jgi:hypothetical protein
LLACAALIAAPGALDADKKKERAAEAYSVVAGTVFREPGFALPEAEVTLAAEADQPGAKKVKKQSFVTNTRGEFAFRVPSEKARYSVTASARGFVRQQKAVDVHPLDRVDVTFMLAPESNK